MQESFFKDKRITVFGLGMNAGGVGTVRFLAQHGAREIVVTDIKSREELEPSLQKLAKYKNITYVLGQHRPEDFTRTDMVIKNPVIPWTNEYICLAKQHGVPVEMDSSLFFLLCKAPIIGVTGTKGKTTTASLIAHILEASGRKVVRAGIGQTGVLGVFDMMTKETTVVFELSSWRLSALAHIKKSPHIAVLTNLYPDHLNYYKTMEAYVADKRNIFLFQKKGNILAANADQEIMRALVQDAPGELVWFSSFNTIEGDGVWKEDGMIFVRQGGKQNVLLPTEKIPLAGEHNIGNVVAAAAAALAAGVSREVVRAGIESFTGVSHRLECVREKDGVRYYNDTTATIPEAAIAALRAFHEPTILICGGSDKRLDFNAFADEILTKVKGVVFLKGDGTDKLVSILSERLARDGKKMHFEIVESMEKAVELASRSAESGDRVLLSPGAASFGIFKNEFDRGERFRKAVELL